MNATNASKHSDLAHKKQPLVACREISTSVTIFLISCSEAIVSVMVSNRGPAQRACFTKASSAYTDCKWWQDHNERLIWES